MRMQIQIWIQGSRTNADPCGFGNGSWSDFKVTTVEFLNMNHILKVRNRSKTYKRRCKSLVGRPFPNTWIRIRICIPKRIRIWIQNSQINADPCSSGSPTLCTQNWSLILKTDLILMGNKFRISKSESLTGLESSRIGSRFNQVRGSGSRRAKMNHKRKKIRNSIFWSAGCSKCSLLRAEGFFCSLDVLYVGLGIGKL